MPVRESGMSADVGGSLPGSTLAVSFWFRGLLGHPGGCFVSVLWFGVRPWGCAGNWPTMKF